jgi:CTP:molybdopterin cytidylyltransferase MocA
VLPRRHWRALRALRGDQGARALLRGSGKLTLVDLPEASFDVDTPGDVENLRSRR